MKKRYLYFITLALFTSISSIVHADAFDDKILYIENHYGSLDNFAPGTANVEASTWLESAQKKHKDGLLNDALADLEQFIAVLEQNAQQLSN